MAEQRIISLHPKLASIFDAIFTIVLLWWLTKISASLVLLWWFLARIGWWFFLVQVVYYPPYISRWRHLLSLIIFNIGITPFLVFSDPSTVDFAKLLALTIPVVSFWLVPPMADSLSVMEKPHRRWKFFMSLFGVAGIWLSFLASITFQIILGWQIPAGALLATVLTALISLWEWNEYGLLVNRNLFIYLALLSLIVLELGIIILLWPVGYFASSFLVTWVWYVVWLMFRFYLTKEGINWKEQKIFLLANFLLMVFFLTVVVRWK